MKKEESLAVSTTSLWDAIIGIEYLIEDVSTAMITTGPNIRKPYGDSRMYTMVRVMVDKTVSAEYESVDSDSCLCQTLDDIV